MGVQHVYEDYTRFLLDEADSKQIAKNIIDGNALSEKGFTFDKDGFDTDLISVVLEKVADTMDVKAMDYKELKKDITACLKAEMTADAEANAAEYLKEFKVCEKLLMIGQRKNITDAAIVSDLIGADVDAFVAHFFQFAYAILPGWQYDDVKFYEDFAFAVLSQYSDLYEKYQLISCWMLQTFTSSMVISVMVMNAMAISCVTTRLRTIFITVLLLCMKTSTSTRRRHLPMSLAVC